MPSLSPLLSKGLRAGARRLRLAGGPVAALLLLALGGLPARAGDVAAWLQGADTTFHQAISTAAPVNVFAKTPDGFLWLGMQDGLARWDGHHQKPYSADPAVPGALPSPDIQTLHVDPRGTLWVGTPAGLARYDPLNDRFDVPFGHSGLKDSFVHNLASDGPDRLWVGTASGLHRVDLDTRRVHLHADHAARAGLPAGLVQALLVDRRRAVWAAMPDGLYVQAAGAARFRKMSFPQTGARPARAMHLAEDSAGRVWVALSSRVVYVMPDGDAGRPVPLKDLVPAAGALVSEHGAQGLREVQPGQMWIATDHGILQVGIEQRTARRAAHRDRMAGSLPDDYVFSMYVDDSGLAWVSMNSTVAYSVIGQRGLRTFWGREGDAGQPSYSHVVQVLSHPDGTLWYGLDGGGIDIFDPADGSVRHVRPGLGRPQHALPKGRLQAMVAGAAGSVYIGTPHGLYRASAGAAVIERLSIAGRSDTEAVESLCFDGERLWLGGGDGLWGLRPGAARRMEVTAHLGAELLGAHAVWELLADDDGRTLWVGAGTGAMALDRATLAVRRLAVETADRLGVPKGHVTSMLKDRQGRLWLGLYGLGVRIVDVQAAGGPRAVRRITKAEGLAHDGVNKMLLDEAGSVWLSTDEGLARVDARDFGVTTLNAADGLGIPGYWAGAGARTADGLLVFGGVNGVTVADPHAVPPARTPARLAVTEVRTGDAETPSAPPHASARLTIAPGQRALMVEYAVLDFTAPAESRYEYRLRGLDRGWKTTPASRRLAAYTNLPPGEYVLELRGASRHGPWSPTTEIAVEVTPAWYETVWLKLGLGAALLLGMFAVVHGRTVLLRQRQRELQGLVEQRTQQLQASQRRLEQLAYFDPLTGLGNRRLFGDELRRLLSAHERDGGSFALLLIDLNRFKPINDTHGHDAGDAVLVAVALRLQAVVREADRVARLGGDEFGVLLDGVDSEAAVAAAQRRIAEALAPAVVHAGVGLRVSASLGAAIYPQHGTDGDALFKVADTAMYGMKKQAEGVADERAAAAVTS